MWYVKELYDYILSSRGYRGYMCIFEFFQVGTQIPNDKRETFSKLYPLFIVDKITNDKIPEHFGKSKETTGREK